MRDMLGKVCVVTGASQGIGRAMAFGLAEQGAEVLLVGRDKARTSAVATTITRETGNKKVGYLIADLLHFDEVRGLAKEIRRRYDHVDVLMNNAGGMKQQRHVTNDGFEYNWQLNHLSPFLLTAELMPLLQKAQDARIVATASDAHTGRKIDFDDVQGEKRYRMWTAYGQSKLANIMFTYALARRLEGSTVTANCFHPGVVGTGFVSNINNWSWLIAPIANLFLISPEKGADTGIYLASSDDVADVSGKYFDKRKPISSSKVSYEEAAQERLWALSAEQTGAVYPF